ncbi:PIN domain-containing protein [Candidatus Magnetomoraceae bacterium gMMP-1]
MNSVIIDTNPLVYIYNAVPKVGYEYAVLLDRLGKSNILYIPKIVYGELSLIFQDIDELNSFLIDTKITIGEIHSSTYIKAAERWQNYNKRRILMCHRCGKKIKRMSCKKCNSEIKIRQHILSDFLIGAYALETEEKSLVTNDAGYYTTYFPELNIITSSDLVI